MTSIGYFSVLSQTRYNPSIVSFVLAMSGKDPLTTAEFAQIWKDRGMMERHPRFHQKLSSTSPGYFVVIPEAVSTHKDYVTEEDRHPVEDHLSETVFPTVYRKDVMHRIKQLQTTPWDLTDSLWRISIAPWGKLGSSGCVDKDKVLKEESFQQQQRQQISGDEDADSQTLGESLLFFQGHHALADGSSMAAALMDMMDEAEEFRQEIAAFLKKRRAKAKTLLERLARTFQRLLWFTGGSIRAIFYQLRLFWYMLMEKDPWYQVRLFAEQQQQQQQQLGFSEMEVDRNLSWTAAAPLDQVKWVAQQLGGKTTTINDLFCACVTAALSRQLEFHRKRIVALTEDSDDPVYLPKQSHMNISLPVHLKGGVVLPGESIGNNIGGFVVRLPGEGLESPEERVAAVHKELAAMKRTPAAYLSHWLAKGLSFSSHVLPRSWIAWMYSHSNAGSVAVVSNNRGAPKHIHVGGRRVESIHGFVPLPPGIPIGVVVMSYAGNINLTLTAEPWAVPDADQFLAWILEEYLRLLELAKQKEKRSG